MSPSIGCSTCPVNGTSGMEAHELTGKEFKLIVLKKLSELQKNTDKPSNEIRKMIPAKNEKFNEEEEV